MVSRQSSLFNYRWSKSAAVSRKPNSVPFRETIIPLVPTLLAGSSDLPGSLGRAVRSSASARLRELRRDVASLFGLAPCGVLPAICLTADAVRSYRTFSPLLPARTTEAKRNGLAVYFLCHYPSSHPDRALPGALPCGVRTFLSPGKRGLTPFSDPISC